MINSGKCPNCQKTISSVRVEEVDVKVGFQSAWRGASYCCPYCNVVLGVGIDPVALKTDTVKEILKGLGR